MERRRSNRCLAPIASSYGKTWCRNPIAQSDIKMALRNIARRLELVASRLKNKRNVCFASDWNSFRDNAVGTISPRFHQLCKNQGKPLVLFVHLLFFGILPKGTLPFSYLKGIFGDLSFWLNSRTVTGSLRESAKYHPEIVWSSNVPLKAIFWCLPYKSTSNTNIETTTLLLSNGKMHLKCDYTK